MEEFSRPATLEDLKALIGSLNRQGADYLLIGGYALFAHGYHRATVDIGVLVPATRQSGEKIKLALMTLPDQAAKDIDPAWFEEGENIRVADAFVVDIVQVLTQQTDYQTARNYWNKLKERLGKEGSESVTNCRRLNFQQAAKRLSDESMLNKLTFQASNRRNT